MEDSNILYFLVAAVMYAFGIVSGVWLRIFLERKHKEFDSSLFVMVAVTLVWIISVVYDMADPTYETHILVHSMMGAIVGFLFKTKSEKKN